jgi:hypothetical protein
VIWLSWRQFRVQALVAAVFLAALAAVLGVTGLRLAHFYDSSGIGACTAAGATDCDRLQLDFLDHYHSLRVIGSLLIGAPAIIGAFWGAPLVARELEGGTHRLVWTQSVTRARWLAVKLVIVGAASVVVAAAFSALFTWWAGPLDRVAASGSRLTPAIFDQRGIVPVGYAAFAFTLGVTAGLLLRRTLPAMATTLVGFTVVRMTIQSGVRPHLLAPVHVSYPPPIYDQANSPLGTNAWVISSKVVDAAGHVVATGDPAGFSTNTLAAACHGSPNLPDTFFQQCADRLGLHNLATLQPASRYWAFQAWETAIFLALALALVAFCFWWTSRRTA